MRRNIGRFLGLCLAIVLGGLCSGGVAAGQVIAPGASDTTILLDKPPEKLGIDLMDALRQRHSTKSFEAGRALDLKDLATLLWAGLGINREDGKRTVPAARGVPFVHLYVFSPKGAFRYEAKEHALKRVSEKQVLDRVAPQPYLASASCILALVADLDEFTFEAPPEQKLAWAQAMAGTIAQNVYLAAEALKLGAAVVASLQAEVIRETLGLTKPTQVPLYLMPVGYPAPVEPKK